MADIIPQLLGQTSVPMAPAVILVLCVAAGVGTVFLLPSRREAPLTLIGGIILLATGLIFAALLSRWAAGRNGAGVYYWIFSTIALISAIRVVTHPKPVYSALYFILTVFATAGLFLLLKAEFMAVALIVIYAGAILVTYVFVIMLAAEASGPGAFTEHDLVSRDPIIACSMGFSLMGVLLFVIFDKYQGLAHGTTAATEIVHGSTQLLGEFLFTSQLLNLELGGLILTVAMVGAIVIARRKVTDDLSDVGSAEVVLTPATPINDDPHSIPVEGTYNPRQKAYPES